MIKDVRAGLHDQLQGPVAVVEIGDEHFDDGVRIEGADGFDGAFEMVGAAVFEVIASHRGDDDVAKFHAVGGFGDALRFVFFEGVGFGGFDGAEATGASAFFAGDHEGRGAVAPAFPAIWALGFFADGDQFEIGDQRFGGPKCGVIGEANFDPRWFLSSVQIGIDGGFGAAATHGGGTLGAAGGAGKRKVAKSIHSIACDRLGLGKNTAAHDT